MKKVKVKLLLSLNKIYNEKINGGKHVSLWTLHGIALINIR